MPRLIAFGRALVMVVVLLAIKLKRDSVIWQTSEIIPQIVIQDKHS